MIINIDKLMEIIEKEEQERVEIEEINKEYSYYNPHEDAGDRE